MISFSICLALPDFLHLAQCPPSPSVLCKWQNFVLLYGWIVFHWYIYITSSSSSIHLSMDSFLNSFFCLFVSGTYSGVQLLGHNGSSSFTFLRTLHNVSMVAVPIYIPTDSTQLVHDKFWPEFQGLTDFLKPNHKFWWEGRKPVCRPHVKDGCTESTVSETRRGRRRGRSHRQEAGHGRTWTVTLGTWA